MSGPSPIMDPTILPLASDFHKGSGRAVIFVVAALLGSLSTGLAQQNNTVRSVGAEDVVGTLVGGALFLTPHVFDIHDHPPACAPCDPSRVSWFDRWAVATPRAAWSDASTVMAGGLVLATWWDLAHQGRTGISGIAASVQTASLAVGATEVLKALIARKRPVLYTAQAIAAAGDLDNQRSLPSGHTTGAFAIATSYWLETGRLGRRDWKAWAAMAAAAGVGVLRVAGAEHFPSDVMAGAAVGVASSVLVYKFRF